jgi:hypothetical protein
MARDHRATARKLRALTASPNEHEAARAREMFEAYITRHQIRLADLKVKPAPDLAESLRRGPRTVDDVYAAAQATMAAVHARMQVLRAESERLEIEYLRRLPRAKRDEQLRGMPPAKQAEYRRQFELLRQATQTRRAARRRLERLARHDPHLAQQLGKMLDR